jgi:hypothetical protein
MKPRVLEELQNDHGAHKAKSTDSKTTTLNGLSSHSAQAPHNCDVSDDDEVQVVYPTIALQSQKDAATTGKRKSEGCNGPNASSDQKRRSL